MENRKSVKLLIPIFILGFFVAYNTAFAYDIETHAYLTSEVVKFYNKNFPNNKISDDLVSYLLDGSRREDDVPRWMNHFYDPIKNRGLTYDPAIDPLINLGTWQKSKDWAQDSNNQNSLTYKVPATIASVLTAIQQLKISALSTETDFTWQRAIRFYAQGDKEKAMFMLSHILHLVEDSSVPDHTRNDPHPEDSPYENYTQKFTLSNPDANLNKRLSNKSPFIFSDLNSYFDELANYSNNNFYSKDTIGIQSGYKKPEPDYEIKIDKYFYPMKVDKEFGDYHLFRKSIPDVLLSTKFDATLEPDIILNDYWSRLSTKSIQYGAGVINLFFQEAEKAKNDPNFAKTEEKSIFAKAFEATKNLFSQIGNFFSGIFGGGYDFQEVGQVALEQPGDAQPPQVENQSSQSEVQTPPKTVIEPPKVNQQNQPQENQLAETEEDKEVSQQEEIRQATTTLLQTTSTLPQTISFKQCGFQTNQSPSRQKIIINEVAWMGTANSANDEWIELKNISNSEVDLSGWQLIDLKEDIKVVFGTEDKRGIINKKIKANGLYLLERTNDDSVPGIVADFVYTGTLSNTNEDLRLFDNQCNLIDEVLANSGSDDKQWPAGDNTTKQTMERKNDLNWQTSANAGGTPKAVNSSGYVGYGGGGGGSASNQSSDNSSSQSTLVIINEIMYDLPLPGSDDGREWVEISNNGGTAVDLTNWKFYENQTNHGLTLIRGSANLAVEGYAIIADNPDKFLIDNPGFAGTIFKSSFSLNNTGETIAIKNGDSVIDEVTYSSDWGAKEDGNSLQKINGEWRASLPTPGRENILTNQANQAPSAFFVYTPLNPQVGDLITFNAASSSDTDGIISLFQWDFGNSQATTTQATTTYSYSTAGNYTIQLIVFDNQNTSSTATSTTISVSASGANHLVISEIMAGITGSPDNEFIELYNPTNNAVSLSDCSLKRKTLQTTTSTKNLVLNFNATSTIAGKSFFLITHHDYNGISTPDFRYTNNSNPLAYSDDMVILYNNNDEIIDEVAYQNILAGQSLERKVFDNDSDKCVSAQNDGEFLGNGCDRDYDSDDDNNTTDFEIRNSPNPQNSLSLPEPRSAPTTPQSFTVKYSSSTMELIFDWSSSQDYSGATSTLTYKITDISASSTFSTIEITSTTATIPLNEDNFGKNYSFSIQAFDKDGFGSATSTNSISVPDLAEETGVLYSQTEGNTLTETMAWSPRVSLIQGTEILNGLENGFILKLKSYQNWSTDWDDYWGYQDIRLGCLNGRQSILPYSSTPTWDEYTKILTFEVNKNFVIDCRQSPQNIDIFGINNFQFYGATSDNYAGYDAVWYNNYGNFPAGSDTEITDIYFVIE